MKSTLKLSVAIAIIVILGTVVSCGKKDDVLPTPKPTPDPIPGTTFVYSVGLSDTTSSYLDFTGGTLVMIEISWDGTLAGSTSPTSFTTTGPITYDVISGTGTPAVPIINISPGTYTNIAMGIELLDNGVDDNIILTGIFTDSGNNTTPIKFLYNSGEVFEGAISSVVIPDGKDTKATLLLNPLRWFKNVSQSELESATLDSTNTIVISELSNAALYDKVETELLVNTLGGAIVFTSL